MNLCVAIGKTCCRPKRTVICCSIHFKTAIDRAPGVLYRINCRPVRKIGVSRSGFIKQARLRPCRALVHLRLNKRLCWRFQSDKQKRSVLSLQVVLFEPNRSPADASKNNPVVSTNLWRMENHQEEKWIFGQATQLSKWNFCARLHKWWKILMTYCVGAVRSCPWRLHIFHWRPRRCSSRHYSHRWCNTLQRKMHQ